MICASTDVDSQHDEKMLGIYTFAVSPEFFVRMFEARGNAELEQLFAEYSARGEARQFSSAESGFSRAFRVSPEGLVLKGIEHSSPPR